MISACTIVARNYLAPARVLAESFFAHHPDGRFTVLLIDDERHELDVSREAFTCWRLSDLDLDRDEIGRLAGIYDVTELATAVKPPLLRKLLDAGSTDVIYLDPDIKLYGPLADASRLAREHGIVLTPHMLAGMPRDGRRVDDFHILAAGVYNLGFIAVGASAKPFIDWWWQRTRREARIDPARMMFTDQRWVDFTPSFFDHVILKDPTYNVAYWNLHERDLTINNGRYLVNGKPLTFFHFSGFDGRRPYLLSKHQGERPRILLSERPALARICHEYLDDLNHSGFSETSSLHYGWDTLPSGLTFDRHMRRLYREGIDAHEGDHGEEPPNPFDAKSEDRFLEWLNEPVAPRLSPTISRYLYAIYNARPDLQRAFPDLAGPEGVRYLEWVLRDGVAQHNIPPRLRPVVPSDSERKLAYTPVGRLTAGVNIAGYFSAELGVGEAGRLLTAAIDAAGIPHSTVTYDRTPSRKAHVFADRGDRRAPHDVNILCVNADQTARFAKDAGPGFFEGRHTVGYWFWELDRFPAPMHAAFDYVDEVWTATRFVASGIRAIGRRPVFTIPLPVPIPRCSPNVTRESLRLPNGFLFLFTFDFFSILERKNPVGLIDAFSRAFRPGEGPTLVIKTINGEKKLTELERVRAAGAGRDDILIIDAYYSAEEKNSLIGLCDCYVSLHRSEGLGLGLAEAMGLGKPVIATGYSGNIDFMTPENSYLVDYTTGAVPAGCDPYPKGSVWAEPSREHAATLMRRVYEAKDEAARKATQARQDILTKHNAEAAGRGVSARLQQINESRSRGENTSTRAMPVQSSSASGHPERPVTATLDYATALLTPTSSVPPGRRLRGPILFLQDLLFRFLRPYWWQQRELQALLISSLRELSHETARAMRAEPFQREALESLWTAVHSIEAGRQGEKQAIATFQEAAQRHLKALTEQLAMTSSKTKELSERLYAAPYMQNRERFQYTDAAGTRVLGFETGRQTNADRYAGFEDVFRGSEQLIRDRFRVYLPLLKPYARVVDIGCGRGELLDLLEQEGVPAEGIDIDEAMVRRCREKGHQVAQIDAIAYLKGRPDASIPAIFAAQVVEHLDYDDLLAFVDLSRAKLQPGGQLIFETVNPHAIEAFKTFYTDLTHRRPIFPEVALVWCWLLGFERAYVLFPNGENDLERDRATQGEYAIVATTRRP